MVVLDRRSDDPNVIVPGLQAVWTARLKRRLARLEVQRGYRQYRGGYADGMGLFSDDRAPFLGEMAGQIPPGDVVNLHWITSFVDYQSVVPLLCERGKVVWTLHDLNPFTGGCHYNYGCSRFVNNCGACPVLGSQQETDWSRQIWTRKAQALQCVARERLVVVTPSHWLGDLAGRSSLMGRFEITVIPNGVDTTVFTVADRLSAKKALGLPEDRVTVLFVADLLSANIKGLDLLKDALLRANARCPLAVCCVGGGSVPDELGSRIPHHHFGRVESESLMAMIYRAADIFAIASRQDNLPNTVMEAMACGIPVVGFRVGGIPEMVSDGETGFLVAPEDVQGLADAIVKLGGEASLRAQMSALARKRAVEKFDLQIQARQYAALYERILGKR